ncbi:MAG: hypothetical protein II719_05090, partial [Clostridia bacterium]|nr:hypothetical protein [Clostridia bacterium]
NATGKQGFQLLKSVYYIRRNRTVFRTAENLRQVEARQQRRSERNEQRVKKRDPDYRNTERLKWRRNPDRSDGR